MAREQVERFEGPVESVRCTRTLDGAADCDVVLVDGRTASCLVDVEEDGSVAFVYFVSE